MSKDAPDTRKAFTLLSRAASLQRRPGVTVLDEDRTALDEWTGSPTRTNRLVQQLSREGQTIRIKRGVYALSDANGSFRQDVLDLIDALTPRPYLVTGGRALQFHGLTDQHFHQVQVLRDRQARAWEWQGTSVIYVKTTSPLRVETTRTSRTTAHIAPPARAIADSLSHPEWGVTLTQAAHAIDLLLAQDPTSADALAVVASRLKNHSLARRLGYLVELVASPELARPFLPLLGLNKAATPLLAGGATVGDIDPRWKVRINVDPDTLLNYSESK